MLFLQTKSGVGEKLEMERMNGHVPEGLERHFKGSGLYLKGSG